VCVSIANVMFCIASLAVPRSWHYEWLSECCVCPHSGFAALGTYCSMFSRVCHANYISEYRNWSVIFMMYSTFAIASRMLSYWCGFAWAAPMPSPISTEACPCCSISHVALDTYTIQFKIISNCCEQLPTQCVYVWSRVYKQCDF